MIKNHVTTDKISSLNFGANPNTVQKKYVEVTLSFLVYQSNTPFCYSYPKGTREDTKPSTVKSYFQHFHKEMHILNQTRTKYVQRIKKYFETYQQH